VLLLPPVVTAAAADEGEYVSGSYLTSTDGSGAPLVFLEDLYGCQVTNGFGTRQDTQAPRLVVAGHIVSANVPAYSSLSAESEDVPEIAAQFERSPFRFRRRVLIVVRGPWQ